MTDSYQSRRVAGVTGGDILFEDFDFSFKQQISHVESLEKAVDKYGAAIREAKACMLNVNECLAEFYEDFWPKYREYKVALKDSSAVWGLLTRHTHELGEPIRRFKQLGLEAQKYLKSHDMKLTEGRFSNLTQQKPRGGDRNPEMFQNMLQTGSDDRRDKLKNVNDEMVEDLNQLFQQRGGFVIDIFKSVYTAHNDFYSESAKISGTILDMVIDLENVRLEMSVGQGKHRRVASTNKPRIGWAKTTPTQAPQPAYQPPPPSSNQGPAATFIPPPPMIGVSKQRGGRSKPDAQDIARPITVAASGRERNPTEFSRGNEMSKTMPGNKALSKPLGRSKQEVQDIARPTNVGVSTGINEMGGKSANKGIPKPLGRSKQEVQDIARPTAVEAAGREKYPTEFSRKTETGRQPFGGSKAGSAPPFGGRGTGGGRGAGMGGVGRGQGVGRGGGGVGRGLVFDKTGRPII